MVRARNKQTNYDITVEIKSKSNEKNTETAKHETKQNPRANNIVGANK